MKQCKHPTCGETCRRPVKKPAPRKQIRKVSTKEQKRQAKYRTHKKTLFTGDDICAVSLLENKTDEVIKLFKDCQYWARQFHHPAGRTGGHLYDEGVKLCGNCHYVVEEHPNLANQLELSKSRLIKLKT